MQTLSSFKCFPIRRGILELWRRNHSTYLQITSKLLHRRHIPNVVTNEMTSMVRVSPIFIQHGQKWFCSQRNPEDDPPENAVPEDVYHHHLPATVAIPEVWPHVPVIATRRNPVFPRFMKILEVFIYFENCF